MDPSEAFPEGCAFGTSHWRMSLSCLFSSFVFVSCLFLLVWTSSYSEHSTWVPKLWQPCLVLSLFTFNSFLETVSYCVVQAGLELMAILPQLPEYWDCRHTLSPRRVCGQCCSVHPSLSHTPAHTAFLTYRLYTLSKVSLPLGFLC